MRSGDAGDDEHQNAHSRGAAHESRLTAYAVDNEDLANRVCE